MNTAKTLQLLDVQSNNISPATNIESIYYEVMDGGVIYRNSIYRHFPIYVNYNNNIDEAYKIKKGDYSSDSKEIIVLTPNNEEDLSNIINASTSTFRLTAGQNDILLSSILQTHLKNTRYYKLDVTTYNFSDIMSLYAPKLWVSNKFNSIDNSINNIKYDSSIISLYGVGTDKAFIRTTANVGNLEKDTSGNILNGMRINDLLDEILFKKEYPYIYDASIYMDKVETDTKINVINFASFNVLEDTAQTEFNIFVNPGKIKIMYHKTDLIEEDPTSKLLISIDRGGSNENIVQKNIEVSLGGCYNNYYNIIKYIYTQCSTDDLTAKTPNTTNYNDILWKKFENKIIKIFKTNLKNYFSDTYLDSINWINDVIAVMYEDNPSQYPKNNKNIKSWSLGDNTLNNNTSVGKMLEHLFSKDKVFTDSYFKMIDIDVSISSRSLQINEQEPTDDYKTNFGTPIDTPDYITNIYCNYYLPYNDYNHILDTILLKQNTAGLENLSLEVPIIKNDITLLHKVNLYVPIFINNKEKGYYITGMKEQYIEYVQNTAQDTIIYIPKIIDNSLVKVQDEYIQLPELYAISQGGIFMPANNWVISSINDTETFDEGTLNIFNIYVIKAQKSYDNNVIGSTRTIKIKIHTK